LASCTAAFAITPTTANKRPGHTVKSPKPLDKLRPWDVYNCRFSKFMSFSQMKCHLDVNIRHISQARVMLYRGGGGRLLLFAFSLQEDC
jgi:hypothetical protein